MGQSTFSIWREEQQRGVDRNYGREVREKEYVAEELKRGHVPTSDGNTEEVHAGLEVGELLGDEREDLGVIDVVESTSSPVLHLLRACLANL